MKISPGKPTSRALRVQTDRGLTIWGDVALALLAPYLLKLAIVTPLNPDIGIIIVTGHICPIQTNKLRRHIADVRKQKGREKRRE